MARTTSVLPLWEERPKKRNDEGAARAMVKVVAPARDSFPAWHEGGITSNMRGGVAADLAFPLGLKAGASTEEWGKRVLTMVAPNRSAGVGEGAERGSSATKVKAAARVEEVGDAEVAGALNDSWTSSSARAALVCAANGAPSDGLRSSSPFSPPSPPSSAAGQCGQGTAPLGQLGLRAPGDRGGGFL
jgi:hypothetical protein